MNNKVASDICINCFGEVLWDCFPSSKRLGGAPLNVCLRLNALGIKTNIISAVGNDLLGVDLLDAIKKREVSTQFINMSPDKATSTVQITLDAKGSATYHIVNDTAWDNIPLTPEIIEQVTASDIFIYGSLVGRQTTSLNTLKQLINVAQYKIFDVNLRKPHYQLDTIISLMTTADFIKLNDDELYEIAHAMGSTFNSLEQNVEFIAEKTNTANICVTKGSHGALLKFNNTLYYNSGYLVKVIDTVGAGDSFLAALIYQLCSSVDAQFAIDFACAVGAMVASYQGATPNISINEIKQFMQPS